MIYTDCGPRDLSILKDNTWADRSTIEFFDWLKEQRRIREAEIITREVSLGFAYRFQEVVSRNRIVSVHQYIFC